MKKIMIVFCSFFISVNFIFHPFIVHASSTDSSQLTDEQAWEKYKGALLFYEDLSCISEAFGIICNPTKWGKGELGRKFFDYMLLKIHTESSTSIDDFMNEHYDEKTDPITNVTTCSLDSTLAGYFQEFLDEFVEANSIKYRIFDTTDYKQINPSAYTNKQHYDSSQAFLKEHDDDLITSFTTNSSNEVWVVHGEPILCFYSANITIGSRSVTGIFAMDDDYSMYSLYDRYRYDSSNNTYGIYIYNGNPLIDQHLNNGTVYRSYDLYDTWDSVLPISYKGGKSIMVFDSREHAVDWITGHRDIYTTSDYGNYQSGNSIQISSDNINNSKNLYNVVNNTVNNYYTDGGGFTDAQIQQIIDAVVEALKNSGSGSGSGSGGSGDDSGSGGSSGGLGGFLDGLGSVLDAILAIAGKLLEYVGKAIQLFTDVIMRVIDVIPKNFTEFLSALFPFLPEECFIAIELMLVLSVILIIINFFKK